MVKDREFIQDNDGWTELKNIIVNSLIRRKCKKVVKSNSRARTIKTRGDEHIKKKSLRTDLFSPSVLLP